jgi:hypothetical protein
VGTPEFAFVTLVQDFIRETAKGLPPWPEAGQLLVLLEEEAAIGWRGRWALQPAINWFRLEADFGDDARLVAYATEILSDENIAAAVRCQIDREKEFRSSIDDLFRGSVGYRRSKAFREMIDFCGRFRTYAPFNNLLVRLQNRSCAFYATAKHWREEFDCAIKEDAHPMLILAPMHPVMLVYDLDSVENPPLPEKLREFASAHGDWNPNRLKQLLDNAERWKVRVEFKALSSTHGGFATYDQRGEDFKMRVVVHNGLDERGRYSVLCHELAHILLGHLGTDRDLWWPSRNGLSHRAVEIEAESVAHIVLTRAGLASASAPYLSSYMTDETVPESVSADLIVKVGGKLDEMSQRPMSAPKPKAPEKKR